MARKKKKRQLSAAGLQRRQAREKVIMDALANWKGKVPRASQLVRRVVAKNSGIASASTIYGDVRRLQREGKIRRVFGRRLRSSKATLLEGQTAEASESAESATKTKKPDVAKKQDPKKTAAKQAVETAIAATTSGGDAASAAKRVRLKTKGELMADLHAINEQIRILTCKGVDIQEFIDNYDETLAKLSDTLLIAD